MRRLVLIAAMFLASASAQASPLRSLSLASSDDPVIVDQSMDQAKTVTAPQPTMVTQADSATQTGADAAPAAAPAPQATEAPKYIERPPAVSTTATTTTSDTPNADTPRTDTVKSDAARPHAGRPAVSEKVKAQSARRRNVTTVAHFIHELHRYGIYW